MKLALTLILGLLPVAQLFLCRRGPLAKAGFWLLDFAALLGCSVLFFATTPLNFAFLTAPLFWQNLTAFVAVTGLLLLLAPPAPRPKKNRPTPRGATPAAEASAPLAEARQADTAPSAARLSAQGNAIAALMGWLNVALCLCAGCGGLACLAGSRLGWLPPAAWEGLTGYCLLWLLPLALRQLLWLRRWLPAAWHSSAATAPLPPERPVAPQLLHRYYRL